MNASLEPINVMTMQLAAIPMVHTYAHVMMDGLVPVGIVKISMNAQQ